MTMSNFHRIPLIVVLSAIAIAHADIERVDFKS
jgi:hypothetical protein